MQEHVRDRELGLAKCPPGLRKSITLQQVIRTTRPARQGIVTFFTIYSLLFKTTTFSCQPPFRSPHYSPPGRLRISFSAPPQLW
jgi:hypothetical protein